MSDSHFQQMESLLAFVILLAVVLGGVLFIALIRSQKAKPSKALDAESSSDHEFMREDVKEKSQSLEEALRHTQSRFWGRLRLIFQKKIDSSSLDEIEEVLYTSDLGVNTVQRLLKSMREELSSKEFTDLSLMQKTLKESVSEILISAKNPLEGSSSLSELFQWKDVGPTVFLIVGVNGAGKTTTIGKLASQWAQAQKKVLVAAGDTFRAAAEGQLKIWTERAQVEIFSPVGVKDPSAVAFDAIHHAKAQGFDAVIVDTAGRLHTQANLMEELKKMKRVMGKALEGAPHETIIVLDANSGQNALLQAKEFHQALSLTGVILTKMDGTAKGGVAVAVAQELNVPIKLLGVGEKISDLRSFGVREYVDSLFNEKVH